MTKKITRKRVEQIAGWTNPHPREASAVRLARELLEAWEENETLQSEVDRLKGELEQSEEDRNSLHVYWKGAEVRAEKAERELEAERKRTNDLPELARQIEKAQQAEAKLSDCEKDMAFWEQSAWAEREAKAAAEAKLAEMGKRFDEQKRRYKQERDDELDRADRYRKALDRIASYENNASVEHYGLQLAQIARKALTQTPEVETC